jgi:hypothetical protein
MTPEYRLERITETIRAIKRGIPLSKTLVALLLEPWPDLHHDARDREGEGWINLLQAAAARIKRGPSAFPVQVSTSTTRFRELRSKISSRHVAYERP